MAKIGNDNISGLFGLFLRVRISSKLNFLAHVYLSGGDPEILIGNFIADFVKGRKKDLFPDRIRQGIELHRGIDDFTDHHPVPMRSRRRLQPKHGKYAGVVVDLYYDHFLARHFDEYSSVGLKQFSADTYSTLQARWDILPTQVQAFLPFMMERNWLLNYASLEGMERALTGLSRRVAFENRMDEAVQDLVEHYKAFEDDFREFFPFVREYVRGRLAG